MQKTVKEIWDENVKLINNGGSVPMPIKDHVIVHIQNESGLVKIWVPLENSQAQSKIEQKEYAGFSIHIETGKFYADEEVKTFCVLKCHYEKYNDYFLRFVEQMIVKLRGDFTSHFAIELFIEEWEDFFTKLKLPLTKEQLVGLYGELYFLNQLLELNVSPLEAINGWKGPHLEAWDFRFQFNAKNFRIECKTTSKFIPTVKVNSFEQLNYNEEYISYLKLQYVACTKNPNSAPYEKTIYKLIDLIIEKIKHNDFLHNQFNGLLELANIFEDNKRDYEKFSFQTDNRQRMYLVDEFFPTISRTKLDSKISDRILSIEYSLNLNGISYTEFNAGTLF